MNWKPMIATMAVAATMFAASTGNRPVTQNAQSPTADTSADIKGKKITIEYNAPSARGREVEGGLVPNGKWWRLGADSATTLTTDTDLKIGTLTVPKGVYTLYLIADDAKHWNLIVNKQTKQWGTEYHPEQDLGRTAMTVKKDDSMIETLKITLKPAGAGATLEVAWGHTTATVPVKAS